MLLEQITAGHSQSLTALHTLTFKRLHSIANSVLFSRMDAEEIVCDALLYVWQHAHRYDAARGPVIAWLTVIVQRRAINLIRRRRYHTSLDADDAPRAIAHLACGARTPAQIIAASQDRMSVQRALAKLPIVRRKVIELAFFDDLTHREIAALMCMPAGTVKSHIRRGLCEMGTAINPDAIRGTID